MKKRTVVILSSLVFVTTAAVVLYQFRNHWDEPKEEPKKTRYTAIGDAWEDKENPIYKLFGKERLKLWSLQKIQETAPPQVKQAKWVRNPIDSFILQKMEAAGKKPAPEADRRTLVRRLFYDLTGLPPQPSDVDAFVNDPSPQAYENLVTRLLDSPAYGEHWGAKWLDVARYSDSNGFDYDEFRPHAWRYRDYVIRALNEDKPFNFFLMEQLAGDEMVSGYPKGAKEQDRLIATGYLRVGPFDNSAVKFGEKERGRVQVMFDVVETTAAAFLGFNFSCCRCHDHKVDPISQADYYRLAAVFSGVLPDEETLLDLAPQQSIIQQERAVAAEKKKVVEAIMHPVHERLHQAKLAKLHPDDQAFYHNFVRTDDVVAFGKHQTLKKITEVEPAEVVNAFTPDEKAAYDKAMADLKDFEKGMKQGTPGFIVTSVKRPPPTHLLSQGEYTKPREIVEPGVLSVFNPNPLEPVKADRRRSPGLRMAFSKWLYSKNNPLTPRVMVNRIWLGHFGEGLVPTPNDFGFSGQKPTHPELLDWLAVNFRENDWSMKKLHRLIVESATYRQTQGESEQDSKTLYVGRVPQRLPAEALRDAMLMVSGQLLDKKGGPPVWPTLPQDVLNSNPGLLIENEEKTRGWYPSPPDQVNVRSVYLVRKRSLRIPMLETFDMPESVMSCGKRTVSTVAPQALTLMNNVFAVDASNYLAKRVEKEAGATKETQVERVYQLALQRKPEADELDRCVKFVEANGLSALCGVVLNLNEFVYVD